MLDYFLNLTRAQKRLISLLVDTVVILSAYCAAFIARFDSIDVLKEQNIWGVFVLLLPVTILGFVRFGLYRAVLRYINSQALWSVLFGCLLSVVAFVSFAFITNTEVPRSVPFIYFSFSLIGVGGTRLFIRSMVGVKGTYKKQAVIIYGAGSAGMQLATALNQGPEYAVTAFVDDDVSKQNSTIQGIKVYAPSKVGELTHKKMIQSILLALPSTSRERRKQILTDLENYSVKVQTIPGMIDIVEGKATLAEVKDVEIDDLLGREPVSPRPDLMAKNISSKAVMVTGAGGSIGSELCRQIVKLKPKKLILFELSEFSLYAIEKELRELEIEGVEIVPLIGSIQNQHRIETILNAYKVQTIYHAAAYKHVPLVEHNVVEGVRNNVFGTLNVARAAIEAEVERFVLVSTDKAVRPTNVMGTTKRLAELVLQSLDKAQSKTMFCMVRFGNVLGSSGSVVPLFRRQIREGGPVTITHMDITRYFMTIPEASQLVIQAGAMAKGGDVFVLDMGESVKILDLAKKMIRLSGLEVKDINNPQGDIEIKCTGLRPGEKLYEELLIGDNVSGTFHERIMTAHEIMLPWEELSLLLDELDDACHNTDHERIRDILLKAPTGFNPTDGICDLVWHQSKVSSVTSNITSLKDKA